MSYTAQELRDFAEQYPFLPHTIFHAKNHRCLQLALKNIEGNLSEVTRSTSLRTKDGSVALRYGAPPTRRQRRSSDEAEREAMQLRIIAGLQSATPAAPVISEREKMKLQAIAAATL
jgi:hypothetical protein